MVHPSAGGRRCAKALAGRGRNRRQRKPIRLGCDPVVTVLGRGPQRDRGDDHSRGHDGQNGSTASRYPPHRHALRESARGLGPDTASRYLATVLRQRAHDPPMLAGPSEAQVRRAMGDLGGLGRAPRSRARAGPETGSGLDLRPQPFQRLGQLVQVIRTATAMASDARHRN